MSCCADNDTGLAAEISIASPNVAFLMSLSGSAPTKTLTIDVGATGEYLLRLWLVDNETDRDPTVTPPDGSPDNQWIESTDDSGVLTKSITHSGTGSWYMKAALLGRVATSDEIAFP